MSLFDRIKAKIIGRNANSEDAGSYSSNMATLVGVQLNSRFEKPSKALPTLMTDTKAAGYLFGFHLACAQSIYGRNADKCLSEIETSYVGLFGEPAGRVLFLQINNDREKPDFQSGMLQGDWEMSALIESGDPASGLKNLLELDHRKVDPSVNALSKFEKVISTWDREQARIALAILSEITLGDRGPLESIFGKGAKSQEAIRHLQVGHLRVLQASIEEITGESFP
jgi:hypothetical protein